MTRRDACRISSKACREDNIKVEGRSEVCALARQARCCRVKGSTEVILEKPLKAGAKSRILNGDDAAWFEARELWKHRSAYDSNVGMSFDAQLITITLTVLPFIDCWNSMLRSTVIIA